MEFIIVNVTEKKNRFCTLDTIPSIVISIKRLKVYLLIYCI